MRKIVSGVLSAIILMVLCGSMTVFAADGVAVPGAEAILLIKNPETGETWEWEIPEAEVFEDVVITRGLAEEMYCAQTSIHVGEYLRSTLGNPSGSSELNDDITIKTGLTYSVDAAKNAVTVYNVFGSTSREGLFYPENRRVYWRNPYASGNQGGTFKPESDSWNYTVNSGTGAYFADNPPYSLLDCTVRISGMSSTREISVMFKLML